MRVISWVLLISVLASAGCGAPAAPEAEGSDGAAGPIVRSGPDPAKLRSALADPLRPEEDRARDADRKPAEVLAFFGIEEGMRVADLQAKALLGLFYRFDGFEHMLLSFKFFSLISAVVAHARVAAYTIVILLAKVVQQLLSTAYG